MKKIGKTIASVFKNTLLSGRSVVTIITQSSGNLPPLLDKAGENIINSISEKEKWILMEFRRAFSFVVKI